MGLNVPLVDGYRGDFFLHYDFSILEPFVHVTQAKFQPVGYVGASLGVIRRAGPPGAGGCVEGVGQPFVQQRRILRHSVLGQHYRGQDLVVHVDKSQSLFGHVGVGCRDGGDGVALVKRLVHRQDIVAQEAEVDHGALALVGHDPRWMFDVVCGDDRFDAGQCQGAAGVYGLDPSVGVRTAQHFTVQHPRKADVGAVAGPPGDLVGPVMPDGPGAYYVVLLGGKNDVGLVIEHALSPEKASCRKQVGSDHNIITRTI